MPRRMRRQGGVAATTVTSNSLAKPPPPPGPNARFEDPQRWLNEREVERRITAIKAIQVAETENILSRLRLVRSYISKEQLETPALKFFEENLPNLSVVRDEKHKIFELKRNDWDNYVTGDHRDERMVRASIATMPTVSGLQFSVDSVKEDFLETTNLNFADFALGELLANQMAGAADALQIPGAMSNRLSFGMTPKTLRLPKNGEMLLSVHGSPLGVYKEENLAAINESGDRNKDAAS